jgi:superfamily II DNA/RNA helicase
MTENFRFLKNLFEEKGDRAGATIIYVPTIKGVEALAEHLSAVMPASVKVVSYHGKQSVEARRVAHLSFLTGQAQVVVATIAFGMGIDKPDIRRIGTDTKCNNNQRILENYVPIKYGMMWCEREKKFQHVYLLFDLLCWC